MELVTPPTDSTSHYTYPVCPGSSVVDTSAGLRLSFRWLLMFNLWLGGFSQGKKTKTSLIYSSPVSDPWQLISKAILNAP